MDIGLAEMMTMRARLLLNLGLVLEEQQEFLQAVELIEKAAELFKKHKVVEDLHRTHIALGALHERQKNFSLALRHIDQAINIDDSSLKAVGQLTKAELLLRIGDWSEARRILVVLYLSKNVSGTTSQQIQRLLRIVVTICRAEENLEVELDRSTRQKLYETLGDASAAVRSYEKALEYYKEMLICAEQEDDSSEQISAALVSLVQTYRDVERYSEAIPFARRELALCTEPSEICRSALNLADLLYLTRGSNNEIMEMYNLAMINARKCSNKRLEASVLNDTIVYLEETHQFDAAEEFKNKLNDLGAAVVEDTASSENESECAKIGDDICLEDLSDVEMEMRKRDESSKRHSKRNSTKRSSHVIKRNAKGETKLHVACIAGNIEEVTKLLELNHPTEVRDHCGWTPLHEAANHGHVEIAELLIKSGANVDDPGGPMCGGVTPLHDAASCGHFSMMFLLMKSGANLRAKTRDGETILDCLEAWKRRSEDLSPSEQLEYDNLHSKLSAVLPQSTKKSPFSGRRNTLEDLTDKDETLSEDYVPERISAGEDYRRTIENVKNRFRPNSTETRRFSLVAEKIPSPLVDSEEMIDDWLEDDLNCTVKEKTLVDERSSSGSNKRKSFNETPENDKTIKRPRTSAAPENLENNDVIINENSCDSNNSDSSDVIFFPRQTDKIKKKKSIQLSLLKAGFSRDAAPSRTPSPLFNYNPENSNHYNRLNESISEIVKLFIRIEDKMINLKLRFPEQRETTVECLTNDIVQKFEDETGCRVKITLTTMSGEILLRENSLKNVRPIDGVLRLVADIVETEIPPSVDRFGKICKSHQIQTRDAVLKCLKISENTSTFRVKPGQIMDREMIPLLKCLEYQEKLQILQLSGGSLYDSGKILNNALKRLSTLQELHLQGCDMDENCFNCLERLPTQLRILDLSYNPLGPRCEEKLSELLSHNRHLQTLNLRYCKLTKFATPEEWSSLVNLDLSSNPLEVNVTRHFLRRQMLSLNLSSTCEKAKPSIAREILDGSTASLRTLESLELACCDLTDEDVEEIISKTANLSKFVVSGNTKLTKKAVEFLLARKPSLTHIDASGCRKIVDAPSSCAHIENPRICTLRASISEDVEKYWLRLWRGNANLRKLPHNIITFEPTVH
ncbi:tonsoku-like protein isoform X2 [Venturia canescens]|nr:tonsoku-like protein isoform X2 [Venturia canescens]